MPAKKLALFFHVSALEAHQLCLLDCLHWQPAARSLLELKGRVLSPGGDAGAGRPQSSTCLQTRAQLTPEAARTRAAPTELKTDLKTSPDESLPLLPRTAERESQQRWQVCGCKHLLGNDWPEIMICAMCAQIYTSNQPQDLLL